MRVRLIILTQRNLEQYYTAGAGKGKIFLSGAVFRYIHHGSPE